MNLLRALRAPWIAAQKGQRWLALSFYGLALLAPVIEFSLAHDHHQAWKPDSADWPFFMTYIGAVFPARSMVLMRDARMLLLPSVAQDAAVGVLCYALLAVTLPVIALGFMGGASLSFAIALLLPLGIGVLFSLERFWTCLLLFLVWFGILDMGRRFVDWMQQPQFSLYGGIAVVLLAWLVATRWRRLLRMNDPASSGRNAMPLVFQYDIRWRRGFADALSGRSSTAAHHDQSSSPWYPAFLSPGRVNLEKASPQAPMTALRVALGGWYLPRHASDRLRQILVIGAIVIGTLVAILWLLHSNDAHDRYRPPHVLLPDIRPIVWLWLTAFASAIVAIHSVNYLRLRWQKCNAELPLLALLPGLDRRQPVKRTLLMAACSLPMAIEIVLLLAALLVIGLMHVAVVKVMPELTVQLLGIGWIVAMVPCIFGACSPEETALWAIKLCGFVLLLASMSVSLFLPTGAVPSVTFFAVFIFGAPLLIMLIMLAVYGWRGWQAFRYCPHPFLVP
jgi:hypothetical protein